jgi:hypothetical protein
MLHRFHFYCFAHFLHLQFILILARHSSLSFSHLLPSIYISFPICCLCMLTVNFRLSYSQGKDEPGAPRAVHPSGRSLTNHGHLSLQGSRSCTWSQPWSSSCGAAHRPSQSDRFANRQRRQRNIHLEWLLLEQCQRSHHEGESPSPFDWNCLLMVKPNLV